MASPLLSQTDAHTSRPERQRRGLSSVRSLRLGDANSSGMTLLVSSSAHHFCFSPPETKGCVPRVRVVTDAFIGNPL
ncbi:hypothetical protein D623_10029924 [Myotis brandtii]|uniref:Uncharacterized protein n=1 Tax=Myotis brandtii TaxID=109478 RepID=S7P7T4_MYOBR|nr:hypothetical protein D623_10029924 [Myotis brandtii]